MIYLVDFENVKAEGLAGIETLNSTDLLVIFLSPACGKTVNAELLSSCKSPIHFVKCTPDGHKNYMDFQIVTSATVFITRGKEVCIISSDKGFRAVCDFWKNNNLFELRSNVLLQSSLKGGEPVTITPAVTPPEQPKQKPKQKKEKKKEKEKAEETKPETPEIKPSAMIKKEAEKILKKCKTQDDLKSRFCSAFGKETGKQLFELYKDKVKKK